MEFVFETPDDFDFSETVSAHGWRKLLPFHWREETQTLDRVERIGDRVVSIGLGHHSKGIRVNHPDVCLQSEAIALVRRILQLDLAVGEFHAFCRTRPELMHVPRERQGRMLVGATVWEDVVKVICTTNVTWSQTVGMVKRIVDEFGSPLPGSPDLRAFPEPEQIAGASLEDFSSRAKLGYRSGAVHRIASSLVSGDLDLESFRDPNVPTADLYKSLLALPGIGPYAASCILIYLGRYERVNVDSWARMMVSKELGRAVSDKEVHAFFEPYGRWKALAYHFYPWRGEEPEY